MREAPTSNELTAKFSQLNIPQAQIPFNEAAKPVGKFYML